MANPSSVTMEQLTEQLGRTPTVNEWLIANNRQPTQKKGRKSRRTVQVFIVSWFPIYAKDAATIQCISRESANRIVGELRDSFAAYPDHDPLIHIDRTEVRA